MLKVNKSITVETKNWIWTRQKPRLWRWEARDQPANSGYLDLDVYIELMESIADEMPVR